MWAEIYPNLWIGDQAACVGGTETLAVVHACKSPCHQRYVGYRGSLPPGHPQYLAAEDLYDLYLNLIDPPAPLFRVESFRHFRDFATSAYVDGLQALLIHCNQGQSRAPILALLFLAKELHVLPDDSYTAAVEAFQRASCKLTDPFIGPMRLSRRRYSSSKRPPLTDEASPLAVLPRPPLTDEVVPLAMFLPSAVNKRVPPPLTAEASPLAMFPSPALTADQAPLAVLNLPPVTEDMSPLAILSSPALIEEVRPLA